MSNFYFQLIFLVYLASGSKST